MLDKPKIVEGDGVVLFKNSDTRVLNNMKEFTPAGKTQYSIKQNKTISQSIIPGTNWNSARQAFCSREDVWRYLAEEIEKKLVDLKREGIIVEDNTISDRLEYMYLYPYADKGNNIHFIGASLNTGYKLNMDWIRKTCGSLNIDIVKDVEKLFGLAKSYWNLKKDEAAGNKVSIDKLEADIIVAQKNLDVARIKVWSMLRDKCGLGAMLWGMGKINLTDPKWRDILFYKDPWIAFATYMDIMTSISPSSDKYEYYDKLISFTLGSLNDDDVKRHWGGFEGSEYPVEVQIIFKTDSKFLGGTKFTRPDGKSF